MLTHTSNNWKFSSAAILTGTVVGIGTALFLAPQTGAQTRQQIGKALGTAKAYVLSESKAIRQSCASAIQNGKKFVRTRLRRPRVLQLIEGAPRTPARENVRVLGIPMAFQHEK